MVETGVELNLECALRSGTPLPKIDLLSLQTSMAMRTGVDSHPVDIRRNEDCRWLQALVFPDKPGRMARLEQAIRIARRLPPPVHQGDGTALLPSLIRNTPTSVFPLIFHSFVHYQFSDPQKESFAKGLQTAGRDRTIAHIAIEWTGTADPTLEMTIYTNGRSDFAHLGTCHPHGNWLDWHPPTAHH